MIERHYMHLQADRATSANDRATEKTPLDAKNPQSNTPVKLTATGGQTAKPGEAQASTLSEADRTRFVQRVARAVQSADAQSGPVKIRLSPPELGSMKIEVIVKRRRPARRCWTICHSFASDWPNRISKSSVSTST